MSSIRDYLIAMIDKFDLEKNAVEQIRQEWMAVAIHRTLAASISAASAIRVLVVEYRLAPEHKYPSANDDAIIAYRWLIESGIICTKACWVM